MEIFDKNLTFCTTFHKLVYVNLYINKVMLRFYHFLSSISGSKFPGRARSGGRDSRGRGEWAEGREVRGPPAAPWEPAASFSHRGCR